jgi:hypothetical protein
MGYFKTLTGKLLAWNDGTQAAPGSDRAAMGDLDSYTGPNGVNSPAQAGFRAIDGKGNAIFDSLGLINVAFLAAQAVSGVSIVGLSYAEIASAPFSPPRAGLTYLFIAHCGLQFSEPANVPDSLVLSLTLDGAAPNYSTPDFCPVGSYPDQHGIVVNADVPSQTVAWVKTIADANSHRASLMVGKTGGSISTPLYSLYAFQLGGS